MGTPAGAPLGHLAAFGAPGAAVNGAAHAGAAGNEEEHLAMPADINLEEARCAAVTRSGLLVNSKPRSMWPCRPPSISWRPGARLPHAPMHG